MGPLPLMPMMRTAFPMIRTAVEAPRRLLVAEVQRDLLDQGLHVVDNDWMTRAVENQRDATYYRQQPRWMQRFGRRLSRR